jgi:PAS domain S-box-containing protein
MSGLTRLLDALTAPFVPIEDKEKRRTVQVLAAVALVITLASWFMFLVTQPVTGGETQLSLLETLALPLAIASFLIPYVVIRLGYVTSGNTLLALQGIATVLMAAVLLDGEVGFNNTYYLVVISIYAISFMSSRRALLVIALNCALIYWLVPPLLNVSQQSTILGPLLFNIFTAMFAFIIIQYWRGQERNRRHDLELSERRYRFISALTSDYHYYIRLGEDDSPAREWSTAALEKLTGYRPEEMPPGTQRILYHHEDITRIASDRKRVLMGERVLTECRVVRKDGEIRHVELLRVPDFHPLHPETVIGYYGVLTDVSARRDAEQQRLALALRREQFGLVGRFISAISHDFRNRLSIIENSRYLLERGLDAQAKQHAAPRLDAIEDSVAQMARQIDALTTVSSLNEPSRSPLNLNSYLTYLLAGRQPEADERGIMLTLDEAAGLPPVQVDNDKIERAISNLLDNAFANTPDGGEITVRTQHREGSVFIEIQDNGVGIAPEVVMQIFEPFFKRDAARTITQSGLGLGLTVARMIVEAHHGHIEVESTVGEGSTFRIVLPES